MAVFFSRHIGIFRSRLSARTRVEVAIGAALLLGSCGQNAPRQFREGDFERLEVADVNSRNAIARIDDLESRVSELEQKLR